MPHPFATDPRLTALVETTERLTAPGMPFEIVTEDVLGEQIPVFSVRAHNLRDVLAGGVEANGGADAYIFSDGRRFTYDDLRDQVGSVARALAEQYGIGAGDRVAVFAANGPEWLLTFWAVASLDAVLVAMNGWWTGTEAANAIELTTPKLVVVDEKRRARLDGDHGVPSVLIERDFEALTRHPAPLPDVAIGEDDPFILIFTSGTTGRPKAAELSHRSLISYLMLQAFIGARGMAMAGMSGASASLQPPRLAPYPMFHVSGLSMAVGTLVSGIPSVWPLGRFDPAQVIALTKQEGVTQWGGGTTHIVRLLDHPDIETIDPAQIRSVGIGGSATPPEVIRRVEERFPHITNTMSTGYGSTETGLISWAPGWMLKAEPSCVGTLMPTVEVRITTDEGDVLPEGAEGNIEARSWMSMIGYWDNPEADAETIRHPGRWIRTGDFGRLESGVLFIASRKRDLIIRGGENIYPFEIEHRLDEHPDVVEAAAFGVDHPVHGQTVKAVAVVRPGSVITAAELQAFCADQLAYYKVPEELEITTQPLPRNATGKVMKHVLSGDADNTFVEE